MRISDWSSDVCSSDLRRAAFVPSLDRQRRPVNGVQRLYPRGAPPKPQPAPAKVLMGFIAKQRMIPLVLALPDQPRQIILRSEERRVGKECVSTCRSRWSPYH